MSENQEDRNKRPEQKLAEKQEEKREERKTETDKNVDETRQRLEQNKLPTTQTAGSVGASSTIDASKAPGQSNVPHSEVGKPGPQPLHPTPSTVVGPPPKDGKPAQLPAEVAQREDRIKDISSRLGEILNQHGGLESNIPVNPTSRHEYWVLKDELNALRAEST